jgi:hypothetical protein
MVFRKAVAARRRLTAKLAVHSLEERSLPGSLFLTGLELESAQVRETTRVRDGSDSVAPRRKPTEEFSAAIWIVPVVSEHGIQTEQGDARASLAAAQAGVSVDLVTTSPTSDAIIGGSTDTPAFAMIPPQSGCQPLYSGNTDGFLSKWSQPFYGSAPCPHPSTCTAPPRTSRRGSPSSMTF